MKYLKLYENFRTEIEPEVDLEPEVSDKTIDDVFKDDFFEEENDKEEEVYQDSDGVYHIKNWTVY
jgi:hypothetical protein